MLDILEEFVVHRGITHVRLDGQVSHEKRKEAIIRFNEDPKVSVFLLSARAGGLGLNLQAADTVILFDLDWNPQNDRQAVARAHRVGQTREVRVFRLVTDSAVERHMEQRCQEKLEMEQKIMGTGMFRKAASSDQRKLALRAVLGVQEDGPNATAAAKTLDPITTPEELSKAAARSNEEHKAFCEMDAKLLKPKGKAANNLKDVEAPYLIRCGRLMRPDETPAGFKMSSEGGA